MIWWIQPLLTFLGIIIGALLVVWQISKQFKHAHRLNKEKIRNDLALKIYNEISADIEDTLNFLSLNTSYILSVPNKFINRNLIQSFLDKKNKQRNKIIKKLALNISLPPLKSDPIDERSSTILQKHDQAQKKVIHLIGRVESYEIIFLDFKDLLTEISDGLEKMRKSFDQFFYKVVQFLPSDVPKEKVEEIGEKVFDPTPPNDEEIQILEELSYNYLESTFVLIESIQYLRIALQNRLLGKIFDINLPLRKS